MTRSGWWVAALLALAAQPVGAQPVGAQDEAAAPLFADHGPLHLTIRGPIGKIAGERSEGAASAATLTVDGAPSVDRGAETLAVTLSPRGITRRTKDICAFPPLRVRFDQPPGAGSLFAGQKRLKLVTHCRSDADFQQYVLLEYTAYRLYNLLTPLSFAVRLALVDYVDTAGRKTISRVGFFIEDIGDVARRNGADEARVGVRVQVAALDAAAAARAAMFNYMIGNLDFALNAGPAGSECCHNARLLRGAAPGLAPVPYDFDFAGLVDAPYATPPQAIPLPSVRTRVYRGFCRFNTENRAAAAAFAGRRAAMLDGVAATPELAERTRAKAAAYLEGFFRVLASPKAMEEGMFKKCI